MGKIHDKSKVTNEGTRSFGAEPKTHQTNGYAQTVGTGVPDGTPQNLRFCGEPRRPSVLIVLAVEILAGFPQNLLFAFL